MRNTSLRTLGQIIGFGIIAGMRSMSAPALISRYLSRRFAYRLSRSPLRYIQTPLVTKGLTVLAASEIVGDKLPAMPDRITPSVLAGRAASGALVGAVISKTDGGKVIHGIIIGGLAAIAATYGAYYLRKKIGKDMHIADPVLGLIEDAIALSGGVGLLKSK